MLGRWRTVVLVANDDLELGRHGLARVGGGRRGPGCPQLPGCGGVHSCCTCCKFHLSFLRAHAHPLFRVGDTVGEMVGRTVGEVVGLVVGEVVGLQDDEDNPEGRPCDGRTGMVVANP